MSYNVLTQACRERRLLLLWAETPFPPLERLPQERAFVIRQWQTRVTALPPAPECLRALPALPLLSLDPTARLEAALPNAAVAVDRRGTVAADRPAVLKLAGDLATRAGLWLTWDDVRAAHSDPDKVHLLAEARRVVDGGVLLALASHPDATFLRLWEPLLAPLAQTAARAFVLGPADFPWPAPLHPLPDLTLETLIAQFTLSPPLPLAPSPSRPLAAAAEIAILPRGADGYPVRITLSDGRAFNGNFAAALTPWTSSGDAQADGRRLFEALFADPALREAWGALGGQSRLRLAPDRDAAELHAIPWELLHDGQTFLAAHGDWPFSRYLEDKHPWGGPVTARPVRVLAAFANPADVSRYDLAPLDVAAERQRLTAALSGLPPALRHLAFLDPPVTLPRLETALRDTQPHILHLMAHGKFGQRQRQAALFLQDANGNTQIVAEEDFGLMAERLGEQRPRLVFLAACESAVRSTVDAFAGLAPRLIAAGVPAVVAMQDKVAVTTARSLTERFYTELFRCGEVDRALNAARSVLLAGHAADVVAPVLYSRLPETRLLAEATRR